MMNTNEGTFEMLTEQEFKKELESVAPRPTLQIGELVTVKGVAFSVLRIRASGKLVLQMLRKNEIDVIRG